MIPETIKILAAMETGNISLARSVWRELLSVNYTTASDIRKDVQVAYKVDLLA